VPIIYVLNIDLLESLVEGVVDDARIFSLGDPPSQKGVGSDFGDGGILRHEAEGYRGGEMLSDQVEHLEAVFRHAW